MPYQNYLAMKASMNKQPFSFSKTATLIAIIGSLFNYGCNSNKNADKQSPEVKDQSLHSPAQGTSIYRYLSAVSDASPDKESLTRLCIRRHGFKLELPKKAIRSAREISLPTSKEWSEVRQVVRQRYRTETIQPQSVNGIIMKPVKERVPYNVTESTEVTMRISGNCIGAEYILK